MDSIMPSDPKWNLGKPKKGIKIVVNSQLMNPTHMLINHCVTLNPAGEQGRRGSPSGSMYGRHMWNFKSNNSVRFEHSETKIGPLLLSSGLFRKL